MGCGGAATTPCSFSGWAAGLSFFFSAFPFAGAGTGAGGAADSTGNFSADFPGAFGGGPFGDGAFGTASG